jgi:hypothetical protein
VIARIPGGKTKLGFAKEALDLLEAGQIRRWQVINRLIHVGISSVEANLIADRGTLPHHTLKRLLEA